MAGKIFGGQNLEVQASQSFHDGNLDCRWRRGIAITSKVKGLWDPQGRVTAEEIWHLQNRMEQFTCTAVLAKKDLRTVPPCKNSFCKWLVEAAAAYAEAPGLVPPLGQPPSHGGSVLPISLADCNSVTGFFDCMRAASVPETVAQALHSAALDLGATRVEELTAEDWASMPPWSMLKPLQRRRLLQQIAEGRC